MTTAASKPTRAKWNNEIPDKEKMHSIKRRALLNAAAKIFNERGYHRTTLDQVSEKLGVSKPTLYYYIKNKEDILFQCSRMALSDINDALQAAGNNSFTGRQRLEILMSKYFDLIITDFGKCMVLYDSHSLGEESQRTLLEARKEIDSVVQGIIRAGIKDKSIAADCDPKLTTFAIFGAYNWVSHWYNADRSMTAQDIKEGFMSFMMKGLAPR